MNGLRIWLCAEEQQEDKQRCEESHIVPSTGVHDVLLACISQGAVQPEVCGALLHHRLNLLPAFTGKAIILAVLLKTIFHPSTACTQMTRPLMYQIEKAQVVQAKACKTILNNTAHRTSRFAVRLCTGSRTEDNDKYCVMSKLTEQLSLSLCHICLENREAV